VLDGRIQKKKTEFETVVEINYCINNPLKGVPLMKTAVFMVFEGKYLEN
jgi:hypothetical protein